MGSRGRAMGSTSLQPVKYSVTRLGGGATQSGATFPGGLDLTTPSLALQPGALRDASNFECSQSGGYARIQGYERVDGRASPSNASYTIVQINAFSNTPAIGNTLTQATSGATGIIIAISNPSGGPYYVAVTNTTGVFDATHNVLVGATLIGTAITNSVPISSLLNAQYLSAAADVYRALIGAVPGSGSVSVVAMTLSGVDGLFAFRPNAGNTAVAIYKKSVTGWALVPFYKIVSFTAGNTAIPLEGDVLTQGGVTATVKRLIWQSGLWAGTAVGQIVISTPSGGNFAGGAATSVGSGATMTLSGVQTAITLLPGGKFDFDKGNFSGQANTRRIYGVDGVNKAFEFDGDILAPITTGVVPDAPSLVCIHKSFLFLAFGSSLVYSAVGSPFKYTAPGGGEIATGDVVTGIITLPGSQTTATLGVFLQSNTAFLYGTDPTTFNYVSFNTGTGAITYSAQNLSDTFVLDALGVVTLKTTLNYGNFLPNTLTKNILPFIQQERSKLTCSSLMRSKSQYRLFFSDGLGLYLTTVNQEYLGAMPVSFPNPVYSVDEDETSTESLVSYFGSSDGNGYVYQLDMGTSFDGANIDAHITLAWDSIKSPRILKRFRAASIEIQSNAYAQVSFGYQLGYGSPNIGQPANTNYTSNFAGTPVWDSFVWDNFIWDGQTLIPTEIDMVGTGENVQVMLSSSTNYIQAYNVNSVIYHYSMRRGMRV